MYRTALKHEVSASEMQYLRDQGLTNKAIAERLEISPATVCRYLQPKSTRLTNADKQALVEMYKNGKSVKDIAKLYEKSAVTIYHVLNDAGIKQEKKAQTEKDGMGRHDEIELIPEDVEPNGKLIFDRVSVFSGRLGEYHIDNEKTVVILPPLPYQLNKDEVRYLVRDLMTIWQEL